MKLRIKTPAFPLTPENGRRPHALDLWDEILLEEAEGKKVSMVREGLYRLQTNHLNPVYQAAKALQQYIPEKAAGVRIRIRKNIPSGVGLGSWATNVAGVLLALNEIWRLGLRSAELLRIGKGMGEECGAFLRLCLETNRKAKQGWAVLAVPKGIRIDRDWIEKQQGSKQSVVEACFPDMLEIAKALRKAGWKGIRMSGNGPALAGGSYVRIPKNRVPERIRKKLSLLWVGKTVAPRISGL